MNVMTSVLRGLLLCEVIRATTVDDSAEFVVRIPQGRVRGLLTYNDHVEAYLVIPFGKVNATNKFKAPFPPVSWEGIREPLKETIRCPQPQYRGTEDCLTLNIMRPRNYNRRKLIPVLFNIFGGNFRKGDANYLGGFPGIVTQGIVHVISNYRSNMYGFLCAQTEDAPGNIALKDQLAALRWVKENIFYFGGDPDMITMFGSSSGSTCADALAISGAAKGLFHRVINLSGFALSSYSTSYNPVTMAKYAATLLNGDTSNIRSIVKTIHDAGYKETEDVYLQMENIVVNTTGLPFPLCIEKVLKNIEPVLTETLSTTLDSKTYHAVPTLIGFNNREGISNLDIFKNFQDIQKYFYSFLPPNLIFSSLEELKSVANEIYQFYFGKRDINMDTVYNLIDYWTDITFFGPLVRELEKVAGKDVPFYVYEFSYDGGLNAEKPSNMNLQGANHADQIYYLNYNGTMDALSKDDQLMVLRMTSFVSNFVKFGNPTPYIDNTVTAKWNPVSGQIVDYLSINNSLEMKKDPYPERGNFWKQMYNRYFIETNKDATVTSFYLGF